MQNLTTNQTSTSLEQKTRTDLDNYLGDSSIAKAMDSSKPSLARIKKEKGEEASVRIVSEFIMAANDFFNVSVKMNPTQVSITSEMIIEKYYYLRVDEIKLCFRKAMFGEYGEIYNRIDGSVIFSWLQKYDESRTAVVAQANQKMSANLTETLAQTITSEIIKQVTDKLPIKETTMDMRIIKPSPFEKNIQDLWDVLPNDSKKENTGFKVYNEKLIDFSEFRKTKYAEWVESGEE